MTSKLMYFGTQERMTWIKAPAYNPDISKVGWQTTNQFLDGGASVRRSITAHKEYQFAWNLASSADISAIRNYADGLYGDGLIYFLDPFAMTTNLLPQYWAAPRLAGDAPSFDNGNATRPTLTATPANAYAYPTKSAVYTFNTASIFRTLYIPIPTGYAFNFGANGSSTGTAAVVVADANAAPTVTTRINYAKDAGFEYGTNGATGVAGTLTQQTASPHSGTKFIRLIANSTSAMSITGAGSTFNVTAGEAFAFSAWVRGTPTKQVQIQATWTGATATTSTLVALSSATTWQQISLTGTVPAGATAVRVDVLMSATGGIVSGTTTLDVDDMLCVRGTSSVGADFTGDLAPTSVGNTRVVNSWQSGAGTSVSQQTTTVAPGSAMTLLSETSGVLTNYTISGVSGVNVTFWGSGTLTLSGMTAQVRPIGEAVPNGVFSGGQGNSGCSFAASPSVQGYSAPSALDFQSLSATLIEVGAWL
jgi:hypothetical protein